MTAISDGGDHGSRHSNDEQVVRVVFELDVDVDESGEIWPPVDRERLWAVSLPNGNFRLDNVPFFAPGYAAEDEVDAKLNSHGELVVNSVVRPSGRSTVRLFAKGGISAELLDSFVKVGCSIELSPIEGHVALDVPKRRLKKVLKIIRRGFEDGIWDYEEACLRF